MNNRSKASLYAILAVLMAAGSAVVSAITSIPHIFIVATLVLFLSGYFAGLARR